MKSAFSLLFGKKNAYFISQLLWRKKNLSFSHDCISSTKQLQNSFGFFVNENSNLLLIFLNHPKKLLLSNTGLSKQRPTRMWVQTTRCTSVFLLQTSSATFTVLVTLRALPCSFEFLQTQAACLRNSSLLVAAFQGSAAWVVETVLLWLPFLGLALVSSAPKTNYQEPLNNMMSQFTCTDDGWHSDWIGVIDGETAAKLAKRPKFLLNEAAESWRACKESVFGMPVH